MKKKQTTIHDIANKLNVTASTVSRALNDHPKISDATKELVRKMAKELSYQPNSLAAALRHGRSNIVGVIVPQADRDFFSSVIHGIEEVVNKAGYNVIICQSNDSVEKEKSNLRALLETQVDAIFVSYAKETTDFSHYQDIIRKGVPLILFDRQDESLNTGSVVVDDYLGAFKATEHLIEQGCRRIVHFSGPQNVSIYRDRRRGYEEALKRYNIIIDDQLIISSNLKLIDGRQHGDDISQWDQLPDGIFSASDYSAMGAIESFKKHGIKIPDQIAVFGFSNESFTSFVDPGLSTIDQHSKKMGQCVAKRFLDIEKNKGTTTPTKTVVTPELIIRGSSVKFKN
jgi:LacI family transcriptional regulator